MKYGLTNEVLESILRTFDRYDMVYDVILYGSRAMGTHKTGSDIDLTLIGDDINLTTLNMIANDLDDLLTPYTFDLSIYKQISNLDLIDHIKRVGISLKKMA